ncbi:MAG: GDSL-type esterase/lipase family protein [Hydrogenophaga sp.]|uniref:GDSL-type esterase/lipase family protein n=1 Tax=Hydrogenophaga sp. TaxID=1904254 RepID=UPI00275301A3|nr:GDSL-type esterase/lipase family protein [Hydrogenophaga sp.]MDP2417233.1 GDSL-type esterase/lipase family protein [Hydrogenophaga sp.]MDZ4188272.1 GDSL-type esterase/lipase family protein [Hydrogenophaga sp.]
MRPPDVQLAPATDAPSPRALSHWLPQLVLLVLAVGTVLAAARTVENLRESVELARLSEPLQHSPRGALMRLLIVGDSTGVGTGASDARRSVAGLLAREFPRLHIENRASDGATLADVSRQLAWPGQFDMVLVQAGGNDVIRLRGLDALRSDVDRIGLLARERADQVVIMPAGNIGNAPFFRAPLSWWMTWRSRQMHHIVREAAEQHGLVYVGLFHEYDADPFVSQSELTASDGLHPSDAGYRAWFDALVLQADLSHQLAGARAP